ncbi:hypothetical protein EGR_00700 [Echinococcus granulosus]|uniref:Uncharacterized protein n=1 Tax=Echinococcus granulosus TaxID=6210 RepID=W6UU38_ECHGR|nr:hypothetical protein EGR_00700 [Echinococcus granulosus]EUB64156.1 hypothetical protein EGR_00700 [Echinococcus granulosus]
MAHSSKCVQHNLYAQVYILELSLDGVIAISTGELRHLIPISYRLEAHLPLIHLTVNTKACAAVGKDLDPLEAV